MQSSKYTTTTFWKPLSRKRSILWNKHPIFTRKLGSCSFSKNIKWKRIWWGVAALDPKLCMIKSSHRRCSIKKVLLKISQISHENTFVGVSFLKCFRAKAFNFIKKDTSTHVFSWECCAIFTEHLLVTACLWLTVELHHLRWLVFHNL